MFGALSFPALILALHDELRSERSASGATVSGLDARWRARAHGLALRRIQDPLAFPDWAKRDRHWSFTLAEVLRDRSLRPAEVAARLMVAMLERIEDELESTQPDLDAAPVRSVSEAEAVSQAV